MSLNTHKYRPDIDGLRAIAVIAVVVFHYFPKNMRGGFVGVDIFFVISGYLISSFIFSGVRQGKFSFLEFYARRARRIFPALIVVLFSSIVFAWFALFPPDFMDLGRHVAGGVAFISNFFFWQETGYFDNRAIEKPLLHLWSLGVEEQFYIIWPLFVFLFMKKKNGLLALIVGAVVLSFFTSLILAKTDPSADFFLPFGRFWQLLCGASLAYFEFNKNLVQSSFAERIKKRVDAFNIPFGYANITSITGFSLLIISIFALNDKLFYPSYWAILPTLGSTALIMAGQSAWINRVVLAHPVCIFVGLISYPLYLWHWPVLSFTHYLYDDRVPAFVRFGLIAASFALAWLTYKFIETPIRKQKPLSFAVINVSGLCLIVGCAGLFIYNNKGFGTRYDEHIRTLVNFNGRKASDYLTESKCFVEPSNDVAILQECSKKPDEPNKQTLMLLGDSYAGHLYAGLKAKFGQTWNVRQITSSGCPPLFNFKSKFSPKCSELNAKILELLKDNPPERVMLSARWGFYNNWRDVASTVAALRQIGVKQIDMIGPVPEWTHNLNRLLYDFAIKNKTIPERVLFGLKPEIAELDVQVRDFATKHNIRYISALSALCDEKGCLTYVNGNSGALTSFDAGHLTREGSIYLGLHFPD
jgi:peptidoglycan/LPS O-acetylase OafA/YrhL